MHNHAALVKHMQHWRKICSIGETYAAFAKHMQHWPKICSIGDKYAAFGKIITKYRACTQKVLGGTPKLKPGQADAPHLNRVEKHHWSPSSIRYLGNKKY